MGCVKEGGLESPGPRSFFSLLRSVALTRLPFVLQGKVAQTACMSACKHLSTSLMQLLLEAEVRQLTLGALQQFNLDVEECERKMQTHPMPHVSLYPLVCQGPSQGSAVRARWRCPGGHLAVSSGHKQPGKL